MDEPLKGLMYAASKDIAMAELGAKTDAAEYAEGIAFHAQQAAEKMVKAAIATRGLNPPKTHQIDDLLEFAKRKIGLEFTEQVGIAAATLSYHAVSSRYAFSPDLDRGAALEAIADCNTIADMLCENGYDALKIDVPAQRLHNRTVFEDEHSKAEEASRKTAQEQGQDQK